MRITDNMMSSSYLRNLSRNQQNVQKYQNQLSSMKEVSKPSENPLLVSEIMTLKSSITQNAQYQTTIEDSISWTDMQDSALSNASNSLMRIKTLVQSAANDTMSDEGRAAVKAEIEMELATFVDALNTEFGGRHVFGGTETTHAPFKIEYDDGKMTGIDYKGNDQDINREIASGVTVQLPTNGIGLVNNSSGELGRLLYDILAGLDANDSDVMRGSLDKLDNQIDNVVRTRTEIGAVSNRMKSAQARNESQELGLKEMLSSKEDIDFAEKYMQFNMEYVAYSASLQMGTKVLQTSILDYL
ncbi:flagellar hook-associated protein FlgL [Jeotgalibaca arthritidis]|uniref:Flagellar hook-associated protein 3 n=1 Tax=Jeotgalibaca arthritidis TaxID=1868794 RepID=A0A6G7K9M7_9LACT|nr:flagellar hook-associated protein FlgL [Jeotgalibaca arthritidis]QII81958.1 flagellar hook-associated protein 3 [Jeotgalibaca arthritidis]